MGSGPTPDRTAGPQGRRSTRLSIAIPIVISGKDANGEPFRENVHTLVINAHGAKIATFHQLNLGAEIKLDNPASVRSVRSCVVWLGKTPTPSGSYEVGVQLLQAQNIWGIAFPPEDWQSESPAAKQPEAPAAEAALHRFNQLAAEAIKRHSALFTENLIEVMGQISLQAQTRLQDETSLLQEGAVRTPEQEVSGLTLRLQDTYGKVEALLSKSGEFEQRGREQMARLQEKLKEASRQALAAALEELRENARKDIETLAADFVKQLHQRLQQELSTQLEAAPRTPPPPQNLEGRTQQGTREGHQIPPPKK